MFSTYDAWQLAWRQSPFDARTHRTIPENTQSLMYLLTQYNSWSFRLRLDTIGLLIQYDLYSDSVSNTSLWQYRLSVLLWAIQNLFVKKSSKLYMSYALCVHLLFSRPPFMLDILRIRTPQDWKAKLGSLSKWNVTHCLMFFAVGSTNQRQPKAVSSMQSSHNWRSVL